MWKIEISFQFVSNYLWMEVKSGIIIWSVPQAFILWNRREFFMLYPIKTKSDRGLIPIRTHLTIYTCWHVERSTKSWPRMNFWLLSNYTKRASYARRSVYLDSISSHSRDNSQPCYESYIILNVQLIQFQVKIHNIGAPWFDTFHVDALCGDSRQVVVTTKTLLEDNIKEWMYR